ncbi:4f3e55db-0e7c-4c1a-83f1-6eb0f96bee3a [Thermothielavioides terrestris]|uniref:Small ribosomal subunit protein uS4m n=2 Tax=Thermothielavioides terrestris TaxID=2587410 RepID=G2R4F0_THETT|nr:uncharacterized protein THITE_2115426 [Thermothielavioides terrestris NRRL 8126]AEO66894.1 hypothetical protein THITE_2115426 [Thermothielavioides terrestris NRRL 8126]SPQ23593.1 4f3e55db-0e7c-4c1a-83f1-6eb0f96bee3a [Thermothielavioides terrestris]
MRQRRLLRFHGLRRPRLRQTWNKYNLFNIATLREPFLAPKTFFQQKWIAKSLTRGYHGEHIKEYQWERMFSRRLLSAVNMDPAYMARYNGSEQAAGRGSGLIGARSIQNKGNLRGPTPYMQMTFAPMERRLDIAIFRALFASSARQARQFVVHGAVTVNGKKMTHPGYLLNPGDMFQVDIERVMTATGKPKRPAQKKADSTTSTASEPASDEADEADAAEAEEAASEASEDAAEAEDIEDGEDRHMATLKLLQRRAQGVLEARSVYLRAKRKLQLRRLLLSVKHTMNRSRKSASASEMSDAEYELATLLEGLSLSPVEARKRRNQRRQRHKDRAAAEEGLLTPQQRRVLEHMICLELENPHDPSKPYATPWRPRDWMAPFAFIPRYLEVNQRICAAVYLRHPVARPGRSEVPTPFPPSISQLAFNWYLRRR